MHWCMAATNYPKNFTSTAHILCKTTTTIPVMTVPDGGVDSGNTRVGDDTIGSKRRSQISNSY